MEKNKDWSEERIMAGLSHVRNMIASGDDSLDPKLMRRLKSHYGALHKSSMLITTLEKELEHHKNAIKMSEGAIATLEFILSEKILEQAPDIKAIPIKMESQSDLPEGMDGQKQT